jgi:guanylate kinase
LEARLRTRGDNADEIARRMAVAREEISHWAEFDHVLVNHSLNRSVEDVHSILRAARTVTQRQPGLAAFVAELVAG